MRKTPKHLETIDGNCDSYLEAVVPDSAGQTQINETRKAFFAGATIAHELIIRATSHSDEDKCMRELSILNEELQEYVDKQVQ